MLRRVGLLSLFFWWICAIPQDALVKEDLADIGLDFGEWEEVDDSLSSAHAHRRVRRKAVSDKIHQWPNATIYYTIAEDIEGDWQALTAIQQSIHHWHQWSCVHFVEVHRNDTDDLQHIKYVQFIKGLGCHSSVGRGGGTGPQDVSIGSGCAYPEMMIHELGHLIGLWHEHARLDRDNNVIILWNNVKEGMEHNFVKMPVMNLLTPYDLSSMMHYDISTFSVNGLPTIKPIDHRLAFLIGYRHDLSFYDKYTANMLYNCSAGCPKDTPVCENEGFLMSDCKCHCPRGLTGSRCQHVETDLDCGGVINVDRSAIFTSPGYPMDYRDGLRCTWLIKSPPMTYMTLDFNDLHVEKTRYGTCRDRLEIRYHHIGIEKGPIFCGTNMSDILRSATNRMIVHFDTNNFVPGRGFNITIEVHPKKDCASSPCLNNGNCTDYEGLRGYMCECPTGWIGQDCEIPIVDGALSEWSEWTECKATCGIQERQRTCTNPPPQNGGKDCEGATRETRRCGQNEDCEESWFCDFGSAPKADLCGITQDEDDDMDWYVNYGQTPSLETGPDGGHTTGNATDMYMYVEGSLADDYDNAILWLPTSDLDVGTYCLQFFHTLHGNSVATLSVIRRWVNSATHITMWQYSGNHGPGWQEAHVNVIVYKNVQLGFMAVKGDGFESDIALDDVSISPGPCEAKKKDRKLEYGCLTSNGQRLAVGSFSYFDKCYRIHCFCNQNGHVDCPMWMRENICKQMYYLSGKTNSNRMEENISKNIPV